MFAKFLDGVLKVNPTSVVYDNFIVFNPTDEILINLGYKKYIDTGYVYEEGYMYNPTYIETEDTITTVWERVKEL